jgi:hypothetical protein
MQRKMVQGRAWPDLQYWCGTNNYLELNCKVPKAFIPLESGLCRCCEGVCQYLRMKETEYYAFVVCVVTSTHNTSHVSKILYPIVYLLGGYYVICLLEGSSL